MARHSFHSTAARLLLVLGLMAGTGGAAGAQTGTTELLIYVGPNALGTAESSVERTPSGWQISGTGQLRPPLDLFTRRLIVRYDANWKPLELRIDATAQEELLSIHTTFTGTTAKNEIIRGTEQSEKVHTVSADTLVMPNLFFATYEALAVRLHSLESDTATLPVYVAPQAEIPLEVKRLDQETIESGDALIRARRFALTFRNPGRTLDAEIWVGDDGRLLRFAVPSQQLLIARSDLARVTTRLQSITRPGDQSVHIPANGFTLVGTLSEPAGRAPAKGRFPAIVLVPGSGAIDRDETVAGIPMFGQLAGALADGGYAVLRYDKRGHGQSGGRSESATLDDYAEDVRMAVAYMARRKDVDSSRIALFGHSEGAWVALLAASREKRVAALVLAAAPSGTGADLVLEQQTSVLNTLDLSEAEKQSRMDLQRRIQAAVLGKGEWTDIPAPLRQQADTPWFRSFLSFDPATTLSRVRQPLLIVQGQVDRQVMARHAERLAELARARKKSAADSVTVATLPGINHLLVRAETGDVAEYARLTGRQVSPDVSKTVVDWLNRTVAQDD